MEATFFAIMFFGWGKVGQKTHLLATWMTGIGASISAVWILIANAWMQRPVGMEFNPDTVRHEMTDFWALVLNPVATSKFFHSVFSGWMTGAIFVIGVSSWYLLRKRHIRFALASIRIAALTGIAGTLAVMLSGDSSGVHAAKYQPMKLAAIEGLADGGTRAPFSVVPGVEIPGMLSILATHNIDGYVPGINNMLDGYTTPEGETFPSAEKKMESGKKAIEAFRTYRANKDKDPHTAMQARKVLEENIAHFGYGYIQSRNELVPPVQLLYWAFRVMVGLGGYLFLLMAAVLWAERKKRLAEMKWLLRIALLSTPLVYLAGQAGWIVAEVGRQPWTIEGLLPVRAAVSSVSVAAVQTTFFIFVAIFTLFLLIEIRILLKAIQKGPETDNTPNQAQP
jgi:cytochrome d ubiquinol oxidase subunit I